MEFFRTLLDSSIAELPIDTAAKAKVRMAVGLDKPTGLLIDPFERDRVISGILKHAEQLGTNKDLVARTRFADFVRCGNARAVAQGVLRRHQIPAVLGSLQARWNEGDRSALAEAFRLLDASGALDDPSEIGPLWVRRALLAVARAALPSVGRGPVPTASREEKAQAKRLAAARSKAVRRLMERYSHLVAAGHTDADACRQVLGDFHERARMKDPYQRALVERAFRKALGLKG